MRYANIDAICKAFARIYPYISKSIRDIKITNIDKNFFSLNEFFTYTGHADEYADYYKTHDINDKNNKNNFLRLVLENDSHDVVLNIVGNITPPCK